MPAGLPYIGGPILGANTAPAERTMQFPMLLAQQTLQAWQGPYPPPDAIERYERVLPGAFDRILTMAERVQAAQIEDTKRAQDYLRDDVRRGHWLSTGVTCLAIVGAIVCAGQGWPWVAAALVSVPVMAVARALVEVARGPVLQRPPATQQNGQPALPAEAQSASTPRSET